jgi:hypothetical protein
VYLLYKICKIFRYQANFKYSCQQVGNIFFVDTFLGNTFLNYGTKVIEFANTNPDERTDPMIAIFPRITKCLFHTYGPSGMLVHLIADLILLNVY